MPEELPSGDKAVYVFLEMIALGFVLFAIEEAFRDNPSWSKVGVAAVLGFICFVTGIKWPQIKAKIWKPIAAGLERTASNRWVVGAVVVVLLTGVAYRYFHRNLDASQTIRQSTSAMPSTPRELPGFQPSNGPGSPAHAVIVTDENHIPIKDAEILLIRHNGTYSGRAVSNDAGVAQVLILGTEIVSVFCSRTGFSAYYQKEYDLSTPLPLTVKLRNNLKGGSVIFTGGTGYIPGLAGRLNPILDTIGRYYLYAENVAVNGGRAQPVTFVLGQTLDLEDVDGNEFEVKIVSILGDSSLLEYRRI